MGKHDGGRIKQTDWRCNRKQCRFKADGVTEHWNFARVDQCYLCKGCRPHNATTFATTPAGKTAAGGGTTGGGGGGAIGGGGGGGGGGGSQTALDKELAAIKAENKKLSQQLSANNSKATAEKKEEIRRAKEEGAKLRQQQLCTTPTATAEEEGADTVDAECLEIDIKHAEKDLKVAAQTLKERPVGVRGHEKAFKDHEDAKHQWEELKQQKRDSRDPHEQLWKKSQRIVKLQDVNKTLCSQLATKLEEVEAAAESAAKLAERIQANKQEMADLEAQAAALTAARSEQTAPDLASVTQANYLQLLGKFSNPLLPADSTITAKKAELESMYKGFADMLEQMAKCDAMLDGAAEAAAAAARAAHTKPPEEVAAASSEPTGVLAITTDLRPDGGGARDTPYAARPVVARPTRTPQSSSTDPGNAAATVQPDAKTKPPRESSESELLASAAKLRRATPASDMDQ